MLPDYIAKATPNPAGKRGAWYANTAPSYAGIFLWIAFYDQLAGGAITRASLPVCMLALAVAGVLSFALYYYVPAMQGMRTGFPLYVIGSSTFGARGGYLMPGLLMGLLQIGWFAVGAFFSTTFILKGLGMDATPGTVPFVIVAVLWSYSMALIGIMGIQYVAKVSLFLNFIPLLMILVVFGKTNAGLASFTVKNPDPWAGFAFLVAAVIGFFATAGAAGADFGMNARDARDVRLGGFVGITVAIVIAGGLPILAVAGAHGLNPALQSYNFGDVIGSLGGFLSTAMFFLFAIASIVPACFCAFIAGNSFSTMIPGVSRMISTMLGVTVAMLLAVTGVAGNLIPFFTIVGASFGPICGAMAADYLLAGRKWAGPREGISLAGYGAWAVGFLIGILPNLWKDAPQPAVVYSFLAGFLVYWLLAKAGLEPKAAS